MEEICDTPAE